MIDLEKLREIAETVETEFFTINADEVLELLDHIAALEKDAGRYEWLRDNCTKAGIVVDVGAGAEIWCTIDEAIDTSMEAKHG